MPDLREHLRKVFLRIELPHPCNACGASDVSRIHSEYLAQSRGEGNIVHVNVYSLTSFTCTFIVWAKSAMQSKAGFGWFRRMTRTNYGRAEHSKPASAYNLGGS